MPQPGLPAAARELGGNPLFGVETTSGHYLDLLVKIQNLSPDQQQAAKDQFFQTHPAGAGPRTILNNLNAPSSPSASQNGLFLKDAAGKDRANLEIDSTSTPFLQFLDTSGNVTNRYPPN